MRWDETFEHPAGSRNIIATGTSARRLMQALFYIARALTVGWSCGTSWWPPTPSNLDSDRFTGAKDVIHIYVYIYIYHRHMCIYVYVCISIHIYIYTHIMFGLYSPYQGIVVALSPSKEEWHRWTWHSASAQVEDSLSCLEQCEVRDRTFVPHWLFWILVILMCIYHFYKSSMSIQVYIIVY